MTSFDLFFNTLNDNMVQYFTGSYWMLAIVIILGIFTAYLMLDLGFKYAAVFSIPVFAFFVFNGWFTANWAYGYYNLMLLCIGFILGLALLKWMGDW